MGLPKLAHIPREEFAWVVEHGKLDVHKAGTLLARKGVRIDYLWIILSGHSAIRVDRGAGPRRVMEWLPGDVGGMLPYSRMKTAPGDAYFEEETELLGLHERHFRELVVRCPTLTAHSVHAMIDRARSFNSSEAQDEKMISLGKLAAGLAHEINNPASATVRAAKDLLAGMAEADAASRALGGARLTAGQLSAIERLRAACLVGPSGAVLSPVQQADREDEISNWLEDHGLDTAQAAPLAETSVTIEALDALATEHRDETLDLAIRWIVTGCTSQSLAHDIERAAARIYELVGAVKRFTRMDNLAGPDVVEVAPGLHDTLRVVAHKAREKGAAITLDLDPDLPRVHATAGELNQVWLNLIDNALDAIAREGRIQITACRELDHVVVRVVDDGPGIPPDVLPQIFDPFFTTKPPGEGTGLGLEIARRLMRRYHGDITASSRPGHTELRVTLQIVEPRQADAAATAASPAAR
jgi:signal transduction histidine kinase